MGVGPMGLRRNRLLIIPPHFLVVWRNGFREGREGRPSRTTKELNPMTVTSFTPVASTIGGALIGLSAVMLMTLTGRIAGVSGIAARLLPPY